MFVIYYVTDENAFFVYKDAKHGVMIGNGSTKKYLLENTKQYSSFVGAQRVANNLVRKFSNITATYVVEFSKFETYLENLKCKCGCEVVILPVGGGCYNIPNVGIIRPICYDSIVPKKYIGTIFAVRFIQLYKNNHIAYLKECKKLTF